MRYDGKVTLVTGGSVGIGEGCVRVFAAAGSTVVFCSRREKEGQALERKVNAGNPGRAVYLRCDVSKEKELRDLVEETARRFGRLDCLINNAGWHPPHKPIDAFSAQDFRDLLEPHLRKTRGNIINMSSLVGSMGQLHATTYVATKGGITALTKALAVDEAAHGVRANSVSPGNLWPPLRKEAIDASPDPEKTRADGDAAQLLGRMGTIEEAGQLCLFLAAEATFTTGVDHILSGGAELAYGRKSRVS
jgi:NAD(P)-dependent dehydrogenase (short-subunit alcohol dehydrogenase family)